MTVGGCGCVLAASSTIGLITIDGKHAPDCFNPFSSFCYYPFCLFLHAPLYCPILHVHNCDLLSLGAFAQRCSLDHSLKTWNSWLCHFCHHFCSMCVICIWLFVIFLISPISQLSCFTTLHGNVLQQHHGFLPLHGGKFSIKVFIFGGGASTLLDDGNWWHLFQCGARLSHCLHDCGYRHSNDGTGASIVCEWSEWPASYLAGFVSTLLLISGVCSLPCCCCPVLWYYRYVCMHFDIGTVPPYVSQWACKWQLIQLLRALTRVNERGDRAVPSPLIRQAKLKGWISKFSYHLWLKKKLLTMTS